MWLLSFLYQALWLSSRYSFFPFRVTLEVYFFLILQGKNVGGRNDWSSKLIMNLELWSPSQAPRYTHPQLQEAPGERESPREQGILPFGRCPGGGAREFPLPCWSLTGLSASPGKPEPQRRERLMTLAQVSWGVNSVFMKYTWVRVLP